VTTKPTDRALTPIERLRRAHAAGLRPDPLVWVDEWAEDNRVLPPGTPEAGPYRSSRTPYLIDIQRTMSPSSPFREGWWQKPLQIGGSTSGENMIGAWICGAPAPLLIVFPTLDKGKQWELARLQAMRASCRELRRRIPPPERKGSDNTKLRKKFPGGWMRILSANRPITSDTVRYIKLEEVDDYAIPSVADSGAGGKGAIEEARGRVRNFGHRGKLFGDCVPTIEGLSEIVKQVKRGDQRAWYLHCPSCAHPQTLVWKRLDLETARYTCEACGVLHTEHEWKLRNYAPRPRGMSEQQAKAAGLAYWEPTAVGQPGVASWNGFNALGAPIGWRPWPELVAEWREAQADKQKLKAFVNDILAEPYKDTDRVSVGAEALQQRAENYPLMSCPMGGLVVCMSVDTQDNRLAVVIRAWGRGEESWGIWHDEIYGDPAIPLGVEKSPWTKLEELLLTPIKHASGQVIHVDACAIDEGGHHTEDVRAFCRDQQLRGRHVFPIAGAKPYNAPMLGKPRKVDFTWRGTEVPGGILVRYVGTQFIKHRIDGRLKLQRPGGGYYHFPLGFTAAYYQQLRAEDTEWRRDTKGRRELWWLNPKGNRNEAWDCETYNYACFLYCMSGRHADNVWTDREKVYGKVRQLELLDDGAPAPAQTSADPEHADEESAEPELPGVAAAPPIAPQVFKPPRRRGGFVNRWR